jgi:hypothetical protein
MQYLLNHCFRVPKNDFYIHKKVKKISKSWSFTSCNLLIATCFATQLQVGLVYSCKYYGIYIEATYKQLYIIQEL